MPATTLSKTATLALDAARKVRLYQTENLRTLISCSKSKGGHRELARHMYTSPLYRKSVLLTEKWGVPFSILSAKYGLVSPDDVIEPYELTLKGQSRAQKLDWARRVKEQLKQFDDKTFIVLAGDDYLSPLVETIEDKSFKYIAPLEGLSLGTRLSFLNDAIRIERRRESISKTYKLFERLAVKEGFRRLREILSGDLPSHGVYFFFDETEPTEFSTSLCRLVRIGTHGVSAGSTATLRTRLRTHYGTRAGTGNHRASVFRLHVGRAIITRDAVGDSFPDWGRGQSASRNITDREIEMERRVSEYISNLHVLFIPAEDASGAGSLRATIERQFIAMFTENNCPLELSSHSWLGRHSDKESIVQTGLWNVRGVGMQYDFKFLPFIESHLSRFLSVA